jgi:hypothetical protein
LIIEPGNGLECQNDMSHQVRAAILESI